MKNNCDSVILFIFVLNHIHLGIIIKIFKLWEFTDMLSIVDKSPKAREKNTSIKRQYKTQRIVT